MNFFKKNGGMIIFVFMVLVSTCILVKEVQMKDNYQEKSNIVLHQ